MATVGPSIDWDLAHTMITVLLAVMFRTGRSTGVTYVGGIITRSPPRDVATCIATHLGELASGDKQLKRPLQAACSPAAWTASSPSASS